MKEMALTRPRAGTRGERRGARHWERKRQDHAPFTNRARSQETGTQCGEWRPLGLVVGGKKRGSV
ncbi:hypothetical protein [Oryza sativa Japonica Group]|uniref:Uncharacterized protein n=1 Tax=Oryza sativa subsp. japonica TaxID=39947 RepID=Q9FP75_ORYSJ|nr:hypothetical protein [Oryza sativa Japonica Group]BAB64079.1 hypothetical protein [Oryza sativa Japonica Group]